MSETLGNRPDAARPEQGAGEPAGAARPGVSDYLKVLPQHLLPQHTLSRLMHRAAQLRLTWAKDAVIRAVIRHYGIDTTEAGEPDPRRYPHFNAFFTRALRPEARPIAPDGALACPADGTLSALGRARGGTLIQAKGRDYTLEALLGGDAARAEAFADGRFATVYLSPRDYHRVHMPLDGTLREMVYVPGRLFSVNASTTRLVSALFARNERLVSLFDTELGPMAVILVGAIFVGSMETVWAGRITPPYGRRIHHWVYPAQDRVVLRKGQEMGRFNMGSTVILLLPRSAPEWRPELAPGATLRMGEALTPVDGAEDPGD